MVYGVLNCCGKFFIGCPHGYAVPQDLTDGLRQALTLDHKMPDVLARLLSRDLAARLVAITDMYYESNVALRSNITDLVPVDGEVTNVRQHR